MSLHARKRHRQLTSGTQNSIPSNIIMAFKKNWNVHMYKCICENFEKETSWLSYAICGCDSEFEGRTIKVNISNLCYVF